MQLSEAIILGSTLVRPVRGRLLVFDSNGVLEGCAFGMAIVATRTPEQYRKSVGNWVSCEAFYDLWPWLHTVTNLPCGCMSPLDPMYPIFWVIMHLFDTHVAPRSTHPVEWTLNELVDWVREQERLFALDAAEPELETAGVVG